MPSTPSGRCGLAKGNAQDSFSSTESARVASPTKRWHHPSRWANRSEKPQQLCGGVSSPHHVEENGKEGAHPKLLDVLGFSPISPAEVEGRRRRFSSTIVPHLPDYAPSSLEHCADDCYWRWLVHTLLHEISPLEDSLLEAQEEFQQRARQRRDIENVIGYRDYILDDLVSMTEALKKLQVDVPQLRRGYSKLKAQYEHVAQKHQGLLAKQEEVNQKIRRSHQHQENIGRECVKMDERSAAMESRQKDLKVKISLGRIEVDALTEEAQELERERDEMKAEIDVLDEAKRKKKSGKGKKK